MKKWCLNGSEDPDQIPHFALFAQACLLEYFDECGMLEDYILLDVVPIFAVSAILNVPALHI